MCPSGATHPTNPQLSGGLSGHHTLEDFLARPVANGLWSIDNAIQVSGLFQQLASGGRTNSSGSLTTMYLPDDCHTAVRRSTQQWDGLSGRLTLELPHLVDDTRGLPRHTHIERPFGARRYEQIHSTVLLLYSV